MTARLRTGRTALITVWTVAVLFALGTFSSVRAQTTASDDPSPHSEATLVSEQTAITPGEPFTVALRLDMEEGWHSYWKNPGASGEPTSIDWTLPDGYESGAIQWPYPHRIEFGSVISYGYSDEVFLLAEITPPDTLTPGTTASLDGKARWLICEEICLPAHAEIELSLPVTEGAAEETEWASAFEAARAKHPKAVADWSVGAGQSDGDYQLLLKASNGMRPDLEGAYFYSAEKSVVDPGAPQPVAQNGDTYTIALRQSEYAQESVERLRGVLVAPEGETWDRDGEVRAMQVDVPVDTTLSVADAVGVSSSSTGGGLSLPWALAFALVGGVLLNLMPCVFPVLSVKILDFAEEAGGGGNAMRRNGLLFGAGVLASMWGLAGVLLGLRAAGSQIGWGFQLQSPVFIALMTMLFFGIGLNLLGTFEVGTTLMNWGGRMQTTASGSGGTSAFLTGVLATVVATPCTAPFMGAALGVALTLSAAGALLIFTALGVGMATPYVVFSTTPALLDRLPEPGAWMETLKQAFAFPMFATAIWLVWVFGRQTSNGGVAFLLAGLLLLGVAAWIVHRWSAPQLSRTAMLVTRGLAGAALVGGIAIAVIGAGSAPVEDASAASTEQAASTTGQAWRSYSPATVEQLRAEGRPIFVDFTAAWCLTCQVNKRRVLNAEAVQQAFDENNVALVRADWTNRDPEITKALQSHGRSGVPVYVFYDGDGSEPELLPEVLTEDIVLNALDDLSSSS